MEAHPADLSAGERSEIDAELRRAADALAIGNDAKARVCARRAAGVALRAWHRSRGNAAAPADAQSLLKLAASEPALPEGAREAAGRLSASVAGGGGAAFPQPGRADTTAGTGPVAGPGMISADPIADATIIIAAVEASPFNTNPDDRSSAAGNV